MWILYVLGGILILFILIFIVVAKIYHIAFTNDDVARQGVKVDENSPYYQFKDHMAKYKQLFLDFDKEEVSVISDDNLTLRGHFVKNKIQDKVVIIFHGYKSKCNGDFTLSYDYYQKGYSLLLVNQRSHGNSDGKYIGMGILERYDVLKWIELVLNKCGENTSILLSGTSMGAATVMMASELIKYPQVKGIVADCGYSSCYEEVRHCIRKLPRFPFMMMINLCSIMFAKYNMKATTSEKSLANSNIPIYLIHGEKDDFVPSYNTRKCLAATKSEIVEYLFVEDAFHAANYVMAMDEYEAKMVSFLERIGF